MITTRPAIPQQWVTDDGYIRLCVAKGTLVRHTPLINTPLACYTLSILHPLNTIHLLSMPYVLTCSS